METNIQKLESLRQLKLAYKRAVKEDKESFIFQGQEMLVSYAKYMIEYMESK